MNTRTQLLGVGFILLLIFPYSSLLHAADSRHKKSPHEESPHERAVSEEIIVTAPFRQSEAQTAMPVNVLSGETLREQVANSLGETLKDEIGVTSASFGSGVGQPVIRGQTGNRVEVLQNGTSLTDASNVSPDHANGVEPILAERIEVLKGPSTLLYGSGAIGGVVNVIDGRIPDSLVDRPELLLEQSRNTVNDEDKTLLRLDASAGSIGFHLDAFRRHSGNVDVNGFAIDREALAALEELAHEGDADHDDADDNEENQFNTRGFIANSDMEVKGATGGISWVGDHGHIGFSISELDNEYGLPPGSHGNHEEEGEPDEEEEEGQEFVRIDMNQTRYDLRGAREMAEGWFEEVRLSVGYTDYEHNEVEIEPDGRKEIGTRFSNEGVEGRITASHAPLGNVTGVWGLQFSDTDFSALGEEAFIPPSAISDVALFAVEKIDLQRFTAEVGARVERNEVKPENGCGIDKTTSSLSGSLLYDIDQKTNVRLGISRSERSPSVEELFSNISLDTCARFANDEQLILHAATGLLEIGDPDLDTETSRNIEVGLSKHRGRLTGKVNLYYNQIDDFIFLDLSEEEIEGQQVANYIGNDATFRGVEAELVYALIEGPPASLELRVHGDSVRADFDSGGNVPRIPPGRFGIGARYFSNHWSVNVKATRVFEQDKTGQLELPTDGYTRLSLYADYHFGLGAASELQLFMRAENLLDEEIRNHTSFLKNFSPEPGRGVTLGLRFRY